MGNSLYWLKGGIAAAILCFCLFLLALNTNLEDGSLLDWLLIFALYPYGFAALWFGGATTLVIGLFQQSAIYFIAGSIIGLVYGKLKN
jgi:hypothetical protein